MNHAKLLLLEANEIPFRVLDDYVERYPESALATMLNNGRQFETICEDQIELDPWISWPTLHRGVRDVEHRILHLGQELAQANATYPPVWELLGRSGVTYGVFGSLHSEVPGSPSESCVFHVPDVFSRSSRTIPDALEPFQQFNLAMTRRSGRNVDRSIDSGSIGSFARFYLKRYVKGRSVFEALKVLAAERFRPHLVCRRRSIQPLIAYDVFERTLLETMPDFATFHTNHVAAAMHRYWAAAYPRDMETNKMSKGWREKYVHEIDYAMSILDLVIERVMSGPAKAGYKVVLATSLGQGGVSSEPSPGFRSIVDIDAFMAGLGFQPSEWSEGHAMVPNVSVHLDPSEADRFERSLQSTTIGGVVPFRSDTEQAPCSYTRVGNSFQLYIYFEGLCEGVDVLVGDRPLEEEAIGIGFWPHQDGIACSGRHTPTGSMIVYENGKVASSHRGRISTLDIAPAILGQYGVAKPVYMSTPPVGLLDVASDEQIDTVRSTGGGVELTVTPA